jgi:hypothetical protein
VPRNTAPEDGDRQMAVELRGSCTATLWGCDLGGGVVVHGFSTVKQALAEETSAPGADVEGEGAPPRLGLRGCWVHDSDGHGVVVCHGQATLVSRPFPSWNRFIID